MGVDVTELIVAQSSICEFDNSREANPFSI